MTREQRALRDYVEPGTEREVPSTFQFGAEYFSDFARAYEDLRRLHNEADVGVEHALLGMVDRRFPSELDSIATVLGYWGRIFCLIEANIEEQLKGTSWR